MVHLHIKLHNPGQKLDFYGTEAEMTHKLRELFPRETEHHARLAACAQAVTDEGYAEVDIEPWRDPTRTQLPEGYVTQDQGEDPWLREADQE